MPECLNCKEPLPAEARYCPACGQTIAWHDNLPLLGWLLLRGRCRDCRASISARYPLIEGLTAALSVIVVWQFGASAEDIARTVHGHPTFAEALQEAAMVATQCSIYRGTEKK